MSNTINTYRELIKHSLICDNTFPVIAVRNGENCIANIMAGIEFNGMKTDPILMSVLSYKDFAKIIRITINECIDEPTTKHVLVLDEFNFTSKDIETEANNILLNRSFEGEHLPDNFAVVVLTRIG